MLGLWCRQHSSTCHHAIETFLSSLTIFRIEKIVYKILDKILTIHFSREMVNLISFKIKSVFRRRLKLMGKKVSESYGILPLNFKYRFWLQFVAFSRSLSGYQHRFQSMFNNLFDVTPIRDFSRYWERSFSSKTINRHKNHLSGLLNSFTISEEKLYYKMRSLRVTIFFICQLNRASFEFWSFYDIS